MEMVAVKNSNIWQKCKFYHSLSQLHTAMEENILELPHTFWSLMGSCWVTLCFLLQPCFTAICSCCSKKLASTTLIEYTSKCLSSTSIQLCSDWQTHQTVGKTTQMRDETLVNKQHIAENKRETTPLSSQEFLCLFWRPALITIKVG